MKKILLLLAVFLLVAPASVFAETFEKLDGSSASYVLDIGSGESMIFLWTSRCPYCISELRAMNKNENICKYSKCFFVNIGETKSEVNRVVKKLKLNDHITKNIVLDKDAILAMKFSVIGVPTFILMRDGEILDRAYHFDEKTIKHVFEKK